MAGPTPTPTQPWLGQQGFSSAWSVMQNQWNTAVQQRIVNLQNISAAIRRVG
jgi:hypothetical protein